MDESVIVQNALKYDWQNPIHFSSSILSSFSKRQKQPDNMVFVYFCDNTHI